MATKLTTAVKEQRPETTFCVNAEKPRKGWFRIQVGGKDVLCLKDMARPFKALREVNLDELVDRVVTALSQ